MTNDYMLYLADAIELCDAWEIPEPEFAETANAQARLMAGVNLEPNFDIPVDDPYTPLMF
tara:strand:- start:9438 stop:9617 length:180 start_codon:yes stop_codon:yes gene_type:complete